MAIKKYLIFYKALFSTQISGLGLALFRISFFSIVFLEVLQIYKYRNIVNADFYVSPELLILWMVALFFMIVGYGTRLASLINYTLATYVLGNYLDFEYHIDYIYMGISFLCIFTPMEGRISLGNLVHSRPPRNIAKIYYFLFVFVGLASVYLESCFHKLTSIAWMTGLGVWLPSSQPQFAVGDWSFLLNQEIIIKGLGYLTLSFEALFILLILSKRTRPIALVIGLLLHTGILLSYPIPYFALAILMIYFLLVPDAWIKRLQCFGKSNEAPSISGIKLLILKGLILYVALMQLTAFLGTPQINSVMARLEYIGTSLQNLANSTRSLRIRTLGMASHQMFIDAHYLADLEDYKVSLVKINSDGSESIIEDSILDKTVKGRFWVHWRFRLGASKIGDPYFEKWMPIYVNNWLESKFSRMDDFTKLIVYSRSFQIKKIQWTKDFYKHNAGKKWNKIGFYSLKDLKFVKY